MMGRTDDCISKVRLVQKNDTGKIYAMKTLMKSEMLKKDQVWIHSEL